jgi:hypothetical protein
MAKKNLSRWRIVHGQMLNDFTKWESLDLAEKSKLEDACISQWALLLAGSETIADDGTRCKIYDEFKEALLQNERHQALMLCIFNSRIPRS